MDDSKNVMVRPTERGLMGDICLALRSLRLGVMFRAKPRRTQSRISDLFRTAPFVLILLSAPLGAVAQNKIGMIVGITGTGILKDADGVESQLNGRNYAVSLKPGQSIRANGQGRIQIKFCTGKPETIENRWRRFEPLVCPGTASDEKHRELSNFFDFGGRYRPDRGADEFILLPLEKQTIPIRPESAVFRWRQISGTVRLSINAVGSETVLWSKDTPGEAKAYASTELRTFLSSTRIKRPNVKFRLTLRSLTLQTENTADFEIFSLRDETRLSKELFAAPSESRIVKHISRAQIYTDFRLFSDAAMEFEEALKLSPESVDLLAATASTEDRAGNLSRRDEIDAELVRIKRN